MKLNVDMSASFASQSIASLRLGVSLYASYRLKKDIHNKFITEGAMNRINLRPRIKITVEAIFLPLIGKAANRLSPPAYYHSDECIMSNLWKTSNHEDEHWVERLIFNCSFLKIVYCWVPILWNSLFMLCLPPFITAAGIIITIRISPEP